MRITRAVIEKRLDELYAEWKFDLRNGYAQVKHSKDIERILAYGEVMGLERLLSL